MRRMKTTCIVVAVLLIATAAFVRVRSTSSARPSEAQRSEAQLLRSVQNASVPQYESGTLALNGTVIRERSIEIVRDSLLSLEQAVRPTNQDAQAIAIVFADFLMLNMSGTVDDAVRSYSRRQLPLPQQLRPDNPEHRDGTWAFSTAWARHADLELGGITTQLAYQNGQSLGAMPPAAIIAASRPLRSGGEIFNTDHKFTAYDVIFPVVAPNVDGKGDVKLDIRVTIVNDGVGGAWDVIQTASTRLPPGKVVLPPLP